jgi:uncharacterized membrane protein required for colicin V production
MDPTIILLVCAGLLVALSLLLRVNAVAIFLTLIAGALVSKLVSSDVTQIINSIVNTGLPTASIVQIFLLVIAPLVLLLGLKGSVKAGGVVFQIVPAVAAGVLLVYFATGMLPYDTQQKVIESNLFGFINPYFGLAAAAGLFASVLNFWATKPKHHDKHHKNHHK